MTPEMEFQCLLVSRDQEVVCTMNRLLRSLSITAELCLRSSNAIDQLSEGSTDLLIIDWDEDSADLLRSIRESKRWKRLTTMAVCATDYPAPHAHVVVRKPVTDMSGIGPLKTAYSKMLRDHRLHARYALMVSLWATDQNNRALDVVVVDIGDGGMGLSTKGKVVVGDVLSMRVLLPGATRAIYIEARVRWTRQYGVAGCEYLRIPPVDLNILNDWIRSKSRVKQPLVAL